jgi:sodium transport system permease protein
MSLRLIPRNIGIVYRKEMVDSLRDRRTLISMIVVPILVMPMMTLGISMFSLRMAQEAKKETARVMILGGEDSPSVVESLKKLSAIEFVPARDDYASQISNRLVRAAVQIPRGFDAALESGEPAHVAILVYEGELKSEFAARRLESFFQDLQQRTIAQRLAARNLPSSYIHPFEVERKNVAPPEKVGAVIFGGLIPYLVILLCLTGAMYPAMDLTAGEKERGTMETILTSPVSRTHLVLGKFLTVLTASLATAALSVCSMALSFRYARNLLGEAPPEFAAQLQLRLQPGAVLAVFAMVLPIAVLFSAALLAISLFAKSYKEAQSYISPLMIVVILPAVASMLPGFELNTRLALIPILNTSLVSKEIVTGTYHWGYMALIFASSCVYAAVALVTAVKLFRREDVLFRA